MHIRACTLFHPSIRLCTKCRRRMLPTKRLMKSSCLETRWRQHIKEQLLTRLRAAAVVAGLQDGLQHPAHHWTRALLGKHQRKGLPWVFVKRASAGSSKHTKYNWCSPPTPTRARLLFFLNLYPPLLHKSTQQHTRMHTHKHIHTLFLSLFQHPPFSLLMWLSISAIPLSLSPMSSPSGHPVVYTFKLFRNLPHLYTSTVTALACVYILTLDYTCSLRRSTPIISLYYPLEHILSKQQLGWYT